jgi:hypothetical protein
MYKRMEINKDYTLKELGLWKISKNIKMKYLNMLVTNIH